jgi:hypothetical protein
MAGTVTITGLSASEPAGERVLGPLSVYGSVVVGDTESLPLASGDNTIPIPSGAVGVVIVPPTTGTATLKYRTSLNASDGGLPINPGAPFVHVFPATAPTSVIINASSGQSAFLSAWVW